jgi:DNA-binding MurR/RpiR family transcriptional regulator
VHERVSAIVSESIEAKRRYFAEHAEDVVRAASMVAGTFGERGDVLGAITTSGTSPNIVRACEAARTKELKVIGLLGHDDGEVAPLCDLALVVQNEDTQRIQEMHNLIGHILCELVEHTLVPADRG